MRAIKRVTVITMLETDKVFAGSIPENYDRYMVPLIFEPFGSSDQLQIAAYRSTGATLLGLTAWLSYLVKAHADLRQFDDAWRCIDEAFAAVNRTKERWWEAEVNRKSRFRRPNQMRRQRKRISSAQFAFPKNCSTVAPA
jgi:hypothetical protein